MDLEISDIRLTTLGMLRGRHDLDKPNTEVYYCGSMRARIFEKHVPYGYVADEMFEHGRKLWEDAMQRHICNEIFLLSNLEYVVGGAYMMNAHDSPFLFCYVKPGEVRDYIIQCLKKDLDG